MAYIDWNDIANEIDHITDAQEAEKIKDQLFRFAPMAELKYQQLNISFWQVSYNGKNSGRFNTFAKADQSVLNRMCVVFSCSLDDIYMQESQLGKSYWQPMTSAERWGTHAYAIIDAFTSNGYPVARL